MVSSLCVTARSSAQTQVFARTHMMLEVGTSDTDCGTSPKGNSGNLAKLFIERHLKNDTWRYKSNGK